MKVAVWYGNEREFVLRKEKLKKYNPMMSRLK